MSLKSVLKVKDPKLSRLLIVQSNVYAAVHGAIGEVLGNHHTVILTNSYIIMGAAEDSGWLDDQVL